MRMPPRHLVADRLADVAEIECALLAGHLRMEHHLQQQVAQFVPEIAHVAAIKAALGDRAAVRVDVNMAWSEGEAAFGMAAPLIRSSR